MPGIPDGLSGKGERAGNTSEFCEIQKCSPAAALCDQSADWTLARQEGFLGEMPPDNIRIKFLICVEKTL